MSRLALGFTQPPTQMLQRVGSNAGLSPPFTADTNNQLHLHSRMCPYGANRDNFTFTVSVYLTRCDWQSAETIERYGPVASTPHRMTKFPLSNLETQIITTGITSIYQPTNAHIISYKTILKHSDMFRSCQIIIRELCSLLELYYSIHNSNRICKRGVLAAYHVE